MAKINKTEYAFPWIEEGIDGMGMTTLKHHQGMTLWDWYAGQCLAGESITPDAAALAADRMMELRKLRKKRK